MDIEKVARIIHEASRKLIVINGEWDEISEEEREKRRIQARFHALIFEN